MRKISKTGILLSAIFLSLTVFLGILIFINVRETESDFVNVQKTESEGLKAMLANPVANMQLTTAREVKRFQRDKDKVLSKPIYAEILVIYEPIGNNTQGDVYDEIVGNIENSGWKKKDVTSWVEGKYYKAETPYGSFDRRLRVSVAIGSRSNSVSLDMVAR